MQEDDRVVVRLIVEPSLHAQGRPALHAQEQEKDPLRKLFLMRKIALTLAFLAIASVVVLILVVMFTSQNS